ncbi:MAG: hypothetical protein QXO37_06870 [Candidatus Nitrosocaldaceae archaeon]
MQKPISINSFSPLQDVSICKLCNAEFYKIVSTQKLCFSCLNRLKTGGWPSLRSSRKKITIEEIAMNINELYRAEFLTAFAPIKSVSSYTSRRVSKVHCRSCSKWVSVEELCIAKRFGARVQHYLCGDFIRFRKVKDKHKRRPDIQYCRQKWIRLLIKNKKIPKYKELQHSKQ